MRAALLLCLSISLTPARLVAELPPLAEPVRGRFWRGITQPEEARADQLVLQGRGLLYPALGLGLLLGPERASQQKLSLESALVRLSEAVALAPRHREARLYYGKALAFWEDRAPSGEVVDKTREAIEQLETLRAIDAQFAAEEVAFQLGVLYTRQSDFGRAVAEYTRALHNRSADAEDTTLLSNLAEVTMLSGDVAGALALYDRANQQADASGRVLSLWGAAVALDRLGDRRAAFARALRAVEEDRAPFMSLHQSGVFFVPAHELFYYEGLGNFALADHEREAAESLSSLLRRGQTMLARPDSARSLSLFEQVLAQLRQQAQPESRALVATLQARVSRARSSQQPTPAATSTDPTRAASEPLPVHRDARALLHVLRAVAAFELYLLRDGGSGPFAQDARDHLRELRAL